MIGKERIELALNHREADRIPIDLGATVMSSLHVKAYAALRAHLGLPPVTIQVADVVQQLVDVDEDVRAWAWADAEPVRPQPSTAAQAVTIDASRPDYRRFTDEWGIGWQMPQDEGWYYDVYRHPLAGEDVSVTDIERYPWPDAADPARFAGLGERARAVTQTTGRAVVLGGLCAGFVEMAGWMRGYQAYLMDLLLNPKLMEAFFDKILELKLAYWERALAEAGRDCSVLLESDDLGSQTALLFSPKLYRQLVKPRHRILYDYLHAHTDAKLLLHSCGSIRPLIPDLIEVGVDILNPVQVSAAGMDSAALKREFGRDLTFWGGGVETQRVLGMGTAAQVKADVRHRIEDLAAGGGFVFATVHAIQGNVPPENVAAVWETLREYGGYDVPAVAERPAV